MGLRFHKSFGLIPGVRLNMSKSGPSLSLGGKGLSLNLSRKGAKATAGLHGTGLSYSTTESFASRPGWGSRLVWVILLGIVAMIVVAALR